MTHSISFLNLSLAVRKDDGWGMYSWSKEFLETINFLLLLVHLSHFINSYYEGYVCELELFLYRVCCSGNELES